MRAGDTLAAAGTTVWLATPRLNVLRTDHHQARTNGRLHPPAASPIPNPGLHHQRCPAARSIPHPCSRTCGVRTLAILSVQEVFTHSI